MADSVRNIRSAYKDRGAVVMDDLDCDDIADLKPTEHHLKWINEVLFPSPKLSFDE